MSEITEVKQYIIRVLAIAARQNKAIQSLVEDQYELLKGLGMAIQKLSKLEEDYIKNSE